MAILELTERPAILGNLDIPVYRVIVVIPAFQVIQAFQE